jgi:hypothetical protein
VTQEWLSIVEYARAFDVSDMTIRRRIKTGKLKAVLKDGKYYIPVEGAQSAPNVVQLPQAVTTPHQAGSHLNSQFVNTQPMNIAPQQPTMNTQPAQSFSQPTFVGGSSTVQPQTAFEYNHIPASVSEPLLNSSVCTIGSEDLLAMVDNFMTKVSRLEEETTSKFKNQVQHLEQSLKSKDLEIEGLKQKIEDVELLVNILEKKQV